MYSSSVIAQQKNNTAPSIALLEYLAAMEEVDGKLVGPQDIVGLPVITNCQANNEQASKKPHDDNSQSASGKEKQIQPKECTHVK